MVKGAEKQYLSKKALLYVAYIIACILLTFVLFLPEPYSYIIFAVPAAIILVVVILKYPFVGLIIYSIFLFVRPQEFLSILMQIPIPLERIVALLVLISIFFKYRLHKKFRFKLSEIDRGVLLFLVISFLSIPFSIWITHSWEVWRDLLRLFIVYIMITAIIDNQKKLDIYIIFIILTSVFHAGASVLNYYNGVYQYRMGITRAIGLDLSYGAPNSLAATLAYTIPLIYYIFMSKKNNMGRFIIAMFTFLILWNIVLTGSRTGMVGVLFVAIMFIMYNKRKVLNLLMIFMLCLVAWAAMPGQYQERFLSTTDLTSSTGAALSAKGRLLGLTNGFKLMVDRPLLGYGIGCFGIATGSLYNIGWGQAHSLPGQLMGELGLLGIIAFIVWMYYLFKNFNRLYNHKFNNAKDEYKAKILAVSLKVNIFALLFFGLGGHNLYRYNWFVISAITVIMLKLYLREKNMDDYFKSSPPRKLSGFNELT